MMAPPVLRHATSVVFCGHGLLLMGASGSGKSDMALRLMDAGGSLVSDDYTHITVKNQHLFGSPPDTIKGLIEVRGVGLFNVPYLCSARMDVVVMCDTKEALERIPPVMRCDIEGVSLRQIIFYPFESSAVAKLRMFLQNTPVFE